MKSSEFYWQLEQFVSMTDLGFLPQEEARPLDLKKCTPDSALPKHEPRKLFFPGVSVTYFRQLFLENSCSQSRGPSLCMAPAGATRRGAEGFTFQMAHSCGRQIRADC